MPVGLVIAWGNEIVVVGSYVFLKTVHHHDHGLRGADGCGVCVSDDPRLQSL